MLSVKREHLPSLLTAMQFLNGGGNIGGNGGNRVGNSVGKTGASVFFAAAQILSN